MSRHPWQPIKIYGDVYHVFCPGCGQWYRLVLLKKVTTEDGHHYHQFQCPKGHYVASLVKGDDHA